MGVGPLLIGVDPKTGYRVFVDPPSTVRLELPECPSCLRHWVLSDTRKFEGHVICKDCGKAWTNYKSAKKRAPLGCSDKTLQTYSDWIDHWIEIRNRNGVVPNDLEDSLEALERYKAFKREELRQKLESGYLEWVKCPFCGREHLVDPEHKYKRCPACFERYKRYQRLQVRIRYLDLVQCDEMDEVLDEYKDLMRRGYWAPDIRKYRRLVAIRREDLQHGRV